MKYIVETISNKINIIQIPPFNNLNLSLPEYLDFLCQSHIPVLLPINFHPHLVHVFLLFLFRSRMIYFGSPNLLFRISKEKIEFGNGNYRLSIIDWAFCLCLFLICYLSLRVLDLVGDVRVFVFFKGEEGVE